MRTPRTNSSPLPDPALRRSQRAHRIRAPPHSPLIRTRRTTPIGGPEPTCNGMGKRITGTRTSTVSNTHLQPTTPAVIRRSTSFHQIVKCR